LSTIVSAEAPARLRRFDGTASRAHQQAARTARVRRTDVQPLVADDE
jgi:hypothetical protein